MDARLAQVSRIVSPFRAVVVQCKPLKPLHPSRHFPPHSTPTIPREIPSFSRLPPTRDHTTPPSSPLKPPIYLRGSTYEGIYLNYEPLDGGATRASSSLNDFFPISYDIPTRLIDERTWPRRRRSKQSPRAASRAPASRAWHLKRNLITCSNQPAADTGAPAATSSLAAFNATPSWNRRRIRTDSEPARGIPHPPAATAAPVYPSRRPLARILRSTTAAAAAIRVPAPAATSTRGPQRLASGATARLRRAVRLAPTGSSRELRTS
ncbi:hypothetical protein PENSPDRAFT_259593 [Peniophora sp. CONT]|nr:hypothetical protein PENSPDRAFT_259593 [Peniophora sp. CONT]